MADLLWLAYVVGVALATMAGFWAGYSVSRKQRPPPALPPREPEILGDGHGPLQALRGPYRDSAGAPEPAPEPPIVPVQWPGTDEQWQRVSTHARQNPDVVVEFCRSLLARHRPLTPTHLPNILHLEACMRALLNANLPRDARCYRRLSEVYEQVVAARRSLEQLPPSPTAWERLSGV